MRDEVPACPPGASRSMTSVRSPSDAPYTAAARPAGPPPTISVSYSGSRTAVCSPSRPARRRKLGCVITVPSARRMHGTFRIVRTAVGPVLREIRRIGGHPFVRDLVAREEAAQLDARRVPPGTVHRDLRFGSFGRDSLQTGDALAGERTHLNRHLRRRRRQRVVRAWARRASRASVPTRDSLRETVCRTRWALRRKWFRGRASPAVARRRRNSSRLRPYPTIPRRARVPRLLEPRIRRQQGECRRTCARDARGRRPAVWKTAEHSARLQCSA